MHVGLGDEVRGVPRQPQASGARPPRSSSNPNSWPINSEIFPNDQKRPPKYFFAAVTFCTREIPSRDLSRDPVVGGFNHGALLHQLYCPSDEV